jgi:hypothetical protein
LWRWGESNLAEAAPNKGSEAQKPRNLAQLGAKPILFKQPESTPILIKCGQIVGKFGVWGLGQPVMYQDIADSSASRHL